MLGDREEQREHKLPGRVTLEGLCHRIPLSDCRKLEESVEGKGPAVGDLLEEARPVIGAARLVEELVPACELVLDLVAHGRAREPLPPTLVFLAVVVLVAPTGSLDRELVVARRVDVDVDGKLGEPHGEEVVRAERERFGQRDRRHAAASHAVLDVGKRFGLLPSHILGFGEYRLLRPELDGEGVGDSVVHEVHVKVGVEGKGVARASLEERAGKGGCGHTILGSDSLGVQHITAVALAEANGGACAGQVPERDDKLVLAVVFGRGVKAEEFGNGNGAARLVIGLV